MKPFIAPLSLLTLVCLVLSTPAVAGSYQGPIVLYENGPVNGHTANLISGGNEVTDSFMISTPYVTSVNYVEFWAWVYRGDTATSVDLAITTQPFGGTFFYEAVLHLTASQCFDNGGATVCLELAVPGTALPPGNYWLLLKNATSLLHQDVAWDRNGGVGCMSPGCPSLAFDGSGNSIPSEAFAIETPEPTGLLDMSGAGFFVLAGVLVRKLKSVGQGTEHGFCECMGKP